MIEYTYYETRIDARTVEASAHGELGEILRERGFFPGTIVSQVWHPAERVYEFVAFQILDWSRLLPANVDVDPFTSCSEEYGLGVVCGRPDGHDGPHWASTLGKPFVQPQVSWMGGRDD